MNCIIYFNDVDDKNIMVYLYKLYNGIFHWFFTNEIRK